MKLGFYCDGAAEPQNPGFGGCGIVVEHKGNLLLRSIYLGNPITNNVAELTAIREALKTAKQLGVSGFQIFSDSQYAIGMISKNWNAIKNVELVMDIRRTWAEAGHPEILWVKGHNGNIRQELADRMATLAAQEQKNETKTLTPEQAQQLLRVLGL